jgi:hypothetical protein
MAQMTIDFSRYFVPPNLKEAKKRGKEAVNVIRDFDIPEDMKDIGRGRTYLIRTYGCR